jgi:predicted nucleic acid-binding protein
VILVDTSAWIEYERATGSAVHHRVHDLIASDVPLAFTEPVLMEFVAGATTVIGSEALRRLLLRGELLPFDSALDFENAASIYRRCRAQGVTPRGFVDCMIAAVALRNGASILSQNTDLEKIAGVMGIELA